MGFYVEFRLMEGCSKHGLGNNTRHYLHLHLFFTMPESKKLFPENKTADLVKPIKEISILSKKNGVRRGNEMGDPLKGKWRVRRNKKKIWYLDKLKEERFDRFSQQSIDEITLEWSFQSNILATVVKLTKILRVVKIERSYFRVTNG